MQNLNFNSYSFRLKNSENKVYIFDAIRKKFLVLTPEEWVRQNFLAYLVQVKKYPPALIAVEKEIQLGEIRQRFDIVVFDKQTMPFMLIECKEMGVELTQQVLDQALRYNITMQVPYVVITNGTYCMAFNCTNSKLSLLNELPSLL